MMPFTPLLERYLQLHWGDYNLYRKTAFDLWRSNRLGKKCINGRRIEYIDSAKPENQQQG